MFFIWCEKWNSLVNKRDLLAYTLVGPTVTRPVLNPLAVLLLDNRLFILKVEVGQFDKPSLSCPCCSKHFCWIFFKFEILQIIQQCYSLSSAVMYNFDSALLIRLLDLDPFLVLSISLICLLCYQKRKSGFSQGCAVFQGDWFELA